MKRAEFSMAYFLSSADVRSKRERRERKPGSCRCQHRHERGKRQRNESRQLFMNRGNVRRTEKKQLLFFLLRLLLLLVLPREKGRRKEEEEEVEHGQRTE